MSETRVLPKPHLYASCPEDERILEYYKGQFDSVYVLLNPFLRPDGIEEDRFCHEKWPSKAEIIDKCDPVSWNQVLELITLTSWAEIDVGLRTSISGLRKDLRNEALADELNMLTAQFGIIHPTEGEIAPLNENRLLRAIQSLGHNWLWVGDEFGIERKLHWVEDLVNSDTVPGHGCVFTHDESILLTTHWDSHFSFLCADKGILENVLAKEQFEGFYCDEGTEVYWSVTDGRGE